MNSESIYEIPPDPEVEQELARSPLTFEYLIREAVDTLRHTATDDLALARMYIQRCFSEDLSHWLVREAKVRFIAQQAW